MRIKLVLLLTLLYGIWLVYNQELRVATSATSGADMQGAIVSVFFSDGGSDEQSWVAGNDGISGEAVGSEWSLQFNYRSTYPYDFSNRSDELALWVFQSIRNVKQFTINLEPAKCVWDIIRLEDNTADENTTLDTDGSFSGFPFMLRSINSSPNLNVTWAYSGVPLIYDRAIDTWYILSVTFSTPFQGELTFQADTDSLTTNNLPNCSNLPTIEPLEVNYIPHLNNRSSLPPLYTNSLGEIVLHLELKSRAASNRRVGIDFNAGTWIEFGQGPTEPAGCQANIDYQWSYQQISEDDGLCYDLYSLDFTLSTFTQFCGVTTRQNNGNLEIEGLIRIRTITDRLVTRSSGVTISTASPEHSQEGFIIAYSTNVIATTASLRVYSPPEITAVIASYNIPQGNTVKSFWVETTIQDPQRKGFHLTYNPSIPVRQALVDGQPSIPSIEANALQLVWSPNEPNCTTLLANGNNGSQIQLCLQRWVLNISINPSVCFFQNVGVQVPFTIKCNDPDPAFCPLTNATQNTVITLELTTDNFCATILGNLSFTGSITPYRGDFSAVHYGFFQDDTVGWEIQVTNTNPDQNEVVESVEVVYLAAAIGSNSVAGSDLLEPQIYSLINSSAGVWILLGADPSTGVSDKYVEASFEPNVCDIYPQPGLTGCSPSSLRFRFKIASSLWPIPSDDFKTFTVLAEVELTFASKRREAFALHSSREMSIGNNLDVGGSSVSGSTKTHLLNFGAILVLLLGVLFIM
eukprot:TRINITY_DN1827_c0_g1_i1.p1 TRINITY_DN1827_c0_g1~~TRINITY_DN1827_c0_g1_i1.p1  ORF type:complete len:747 (-),score=138.64 TRINITY_DN1827_c0_g1_i1:35-2275(-)